jgi:GntR family transcriptional regulator
MTALRSGARPLYSQLKETILDEIASGRLKPGDRLPSHRELGETYQMSHMTVRRAISELTNEGVISAVPGKGIYVAEPKEDADSGALISFHEDMARRGMTGQTRTLDAYMTTASTALSQIMGLDPGAPLVYMRRLLLAGDTPMGIAHNYLAHHLCPGFLDQELVNGSLYATLTTRYGLRLASGTRTAEAVLADAEQTELMRLAPGVPAPLLLIEQLTFLESGAAIEYSRILYRGDRYRVPVK